MSKTFRSEVKKAETNKKTTQMKIGQQLRIDFGRAELCNGNDDIKFNRNGSSKMLDEILSRENVTTALKRVKSNKGAAGVDGMTADKLQSYIETNRTSIKAEILDGTYRPAPVRQVMIKKPDGGERQLIMGWVNYFKIAKAKSQMQRLDEWTRTRLRICVWKL